LFLSRLRDTNTFKVATKILADFSTAWQREHVGPDAVRIYRNWLSYMAERKGRKPQARCVVEAR